MAPLRQSMRAYIRYVSHAWWALAFGAPGALLGYVTAIWTDVRIPPIGWIAFAMALLVIAQFQAFYRIFSEQQVTKAAETPVLEDPVGLTQRTYALLGTSPLESAFSIHNYGRPLDSSERGLVMRSVVAQPAPPQEIELTSAAKRSFLEQMQTSKLEAWLRTLPARSEDSPEWRLTDPTGLLIATVKSPQVSAEPDGASFSAEATFQIPSPPRHWGWVALIVDVIAIPSSGTGGNPHFFDLSSFLTALEALVECSIDVAESMTGLVEGDRLQQNDLVGPSVMVYAGSSELTSFIAIPEFERASGTTGRSSFSIHASAASDVQGPTSLRDFIRGGLARMLAADGYVDFEHHLQHL